jgi:hypothetical protein
MARPRAGHGRTAFFRNGKMVWLIGDCHGRWVTTYEAKKWPRCERCRRPEHIMPEGSKLCTTCYYYKSLPKGEFWNRKEDYLFPYNIGKRSMEHMGWDRGPLEDPRVNWRQYLRAQMAGRH